MAATVVVPDASVILKWVLPSADEPDTERALALRDAIAVGDVRALAPELWVYGAEARFDWRRKEAYALAYTFWTREFPDDTA